MGRTLERRVSWFDALNVLPLLKTRYRSARPADYDPRSLDIEIVRNLDDFEALETEWNGLFARAGTSQQLFQSFNWNWHWCQSYLVENGDAEAKALSIVVGRHAGRIVMIWPLVASYKLGFRQICWMGAPVTQYSDVLVEAGPFREAWLAEGWRTVCEDLGAHLICMPKVREDAALMDLVRTLDLKPFSRTEAPCADLTGIGTFDEYAERRSKRERRNRKRQWRRLKDYGSVSIEVLTAGTQTAAAARNAISMKRRWLSRKGLVSKAFAGNGIDHFFSRALSCPERPVNGRVVVLKVKGEVAAVEIGVICQDRFAPHISAYSLDPQFANTAAGALVREASIGHCCTSGFATYDLMAPNDAYKYQWAEGSVPVYDFVVTLTPSGRVLGWAGACAHTAMKTAFEAAPQRIRRLVASQINQMIARLTNGAAAPA